MDDRASSLEPAMIVEQATTPGGMELSMSGSVSLPVWAAVLLALITASIAPLVSYRTAKWQRRSGMETVAAMDRNAQVTKQSAVASARSAEAAERAADTASQAERQLTKFRLHDDTMRTLYWAADHAIAPESNRALLGLEVLGKLAEQAHEDDDHRARHIVSATDEAVRKVAVPTFLAVLTTAVNDDETGGGHMVASAVEINAARLLVAHDPHLSPELRAEIQRIAELVPGAEITVEHLYTGRHVEQERTLSRGLERTQGLSPEAANLERQRNLARNRGLGRGRSPGLGRER